MRNTRSTWVNSLGPYRWPAPEAFASEGGCAPRRLPSLQYAPIDYDLGSRPNARPVERGTALNPDPLVARRMRRDRPSARHGSRSRSLGTGVLRLGAPPRRDDVALDGIVRA